MCKRFKIFKVSKCARVVHSLAGEGNEVPASVIRNGKKARDAIFPFCCNPASPYFPVFSSWQQLACLNRNLTWSLFSATVFCGPHYNAQVFGSPIYKYKWHIYRIVHTRLREELFELLIFWTFHFLCGRDYTSGIGPPTLKVNIPMLLTGPGWAPISARLWACFAWASCGIVWACFSWGA